MGVLVSAGIGLIHCGGADTPFTAAEECQGEDCAETPPPSENPTPIDADADGSALPDDCNDDDASIHPGATDECDDGIDQDCSGTDCLAPDDPIIEDAVRCELTFTHTLSLGIIDPAGASIEEAPVSNDNYDMAIQVGAESIALKAEDIPTYKWFIPAGDDVILSVCFVISPTSGTYYGPKTASQMELDGVVYHADMYLADSCNDADLEGNLLGEDDITVDLTTGTATLQGKSTIGSWDTINADIVGIVAFPKGIYEEIGMYDTALVTMRLSGTFPQDPATITGSNCEEEDPPPPPDPPTTTTTNLTLATTDAGTTTARSSGSTLDFGTITPETVVARHVTLKNEGTAAIALSHVRLESTGGHFTLSPVESDLVGSLAAGASKTVAIAYNSIGVLANDESNALIVEITDSSNQSKLTLDVHAKVSSSTEILAARAYDSSTGAVVSVSASGVIDPAAYGDSVTVLIENISAELLTVTGIDVIDVGSSGITLDPPQISAVSNGADASSGFAGNECTTAYSDLAAHCYQTLVPGSDNLALAMPANDTDRTVLARAVIHNASDAANDATLMIGYTHADGSEDSLSIALYPSTSGFNHPGDLEPIEPTTPILKH